MKLKFFVVTIVVLLLGVVGIASAQIGPCYNNPNIGISNTNNCNLHSGIGVGLSREQEAKIIRAVDIFESNSEVVVGVCLKGSGGLLYSRADIIPRAAFWAWSYTTADGFVCTNVNRPGVVVLISDSSPVASFSAPATTASGEAGTTSTTSTTTTTTTTTSAPATTLSSNARIELTGCTVVTRAILNFRDAPATNSNVKDLIPYRSILRAIARQGTWYNVVYGSDNGWVAASLVNTRGTCSG